MQEETRISERIGQDFGNYRLTSLIGRGGFAEVYLGEHVYLKTQAAIKILRTRLAQAEQESFYAEARTIAHLQHDHIVRVLEFGVKDGSIPYLVMEYAAHGTLRERFPKGTPTPPAHILLPFKQVAAALQHAHNENLIHRDIKPENMLVGAHNEVLLSDFGIALIVKSSRHQDAQDVAGTVTYMAPEQLLGQPTKASDQYALGVVTYEWLTGERLFRGSFTEIACQHALTPPTPLRTHVPSISPTLEHVVLTALAKDQRQRFPNVQDFANALEAATQPGQAYTIAPIASPTSTGTHTPHILLPSTGPQPISLPPQQPDQKEARKVARSVKIALLTLALLLIFGSGLTYALLRARPNAQQITAQKMQALYSQSTSGQPQIEDSLQSESSLEWNVSGNCMFAGGVLHTVQVPEADCVSSYIDLSNFAYQVEMTVVQGSSGGLIFRFNLPFGTGPTGLYYFTVTTQGKFDLATKTISYITTNTQSESPLKPLIQPQSSAAIKTGLNQTNLLTVISRGPNIYLYINKQYVGSIQDKTSLSGTMGMFRTDNSGNIADVTFKNLQIWSL